MIWLYFCSHTVFLFDEVTAVVPSIFNLKTCTHLFLCAHPDQELMRITGLQCNSQLFEKSTVRKVCGDLPHTRTLPPSFALQSHTRHCPTSVHRDLEDSTNIHIYLLAAKNPRTLPTTSSSPLQTSAPSINFDCKAPLANPSHNSSREIVSLKTEPSSKNKTNHLSIKRFFPQNNHFEMN